MSHFEGDYYDIDAILAEEEATPVLMLADAYKLGYLDPGNVTADVRDVLQTRFHTVLFFFFKKNIIENIWFV